MSDITNAMARDLEEAERKARAAALETDEKNYMETESRVDRACSIICIIAVVVVAVLLVWLKVRQPAAERAAYLEGRHGIDHATAVAMAREGFGPTAEEVVHAR
ncbi:MAG: hypothetical protein IIZ83_01435 [Oscillospiraceae bacterium]|nr:hypothetical protein [Oscillospiraceae bacterium]